MYIRDANIIIIVFDISVKITFDHVKTWLKEVSDIKKQDAIIAVVGNKLDLNVKEVSQEDIDNFVNEFGYILCCMSAKSGEGVDFFFEQIYSKITENFNLQGGDQDDLNITEKFDINKIKQTTSKGKKKCCKG